MLSLSSQLGLFAALLLMGGCGTTSEDLPSSSQEAAPATIPETHPVPSNDTSTGNDSDSIEKTRERLDDIRRENIAAVQLALEEMQEGENIEVNEQIFDKCAAPLRRAKYRMEKRNGALHIGLTVHLTPDEMAIRSGIGRRLVARVQGCTGYVRAFMLRNDIQFDLVFTDSDSSVADREVTLHPGAPISQRVEDRGNAGEYYENFDCGSITHEVMHLLGLPDEYYEQNTVRTRECEAPETVPPFSIMKTSTMHSELFPRHLKALLAPAFSRYPALKYPAEVLLKVERHFEKDPRLGYTDGIHDCAVMFSGSGEQMNPPIGTVFKFPFTRENVTFNRVNGKLNGTLLTMRSKRTRKYPPAFLSCLLGIDDPIGEAMSLLNPVFSLRLRDSI